MKENRGGARAGAGRKPIYVISEREVKTLVKAARKKAKQTGKSLADVLVDLSYQTDDKRTALSAIRIYYDNVVLKGKEEQRAVSDDQPHGPLILPRKAWSILKYVPRDAFKARVILPEKGPDPAAKLIAHKGPTPSKAGSHDKKDGQ